MSEEQKEAAPLHGRYVVDAKGKIVGRISLSTMRLDSDGRAYAFFCSNSICGSNATNKLGYRLSYALISAISATEQKVNRLLISTFQFELADENITLYDLI